MDLHGTLSSPATDYGKRPNVFRLRFQNGAEYLFQCRDQDEMTHWVSRITDAVGRAGEASGAGWAQRAQTLPATAVARAAGEAAESAPPAEAPASPGSRRTPQREPSKGKEKKGISFTMGKKK